MILISANPANPKHFTGRKATSKPGRKASKKGASAMAKKHRTAKQKAATARMIAANKRSRKVHHNPTHTTKRKATKRRSVSVHRNPAPRRRKTYRNPGIFGSGGALGELISKEGLLMVAGAMAAPMVTDYVQEKIMPTATGWVKVGVKAGLVLAGGWAIDKFLKQRKAALAYLVTGAAVVASDAVQIARGVMQGLSASEADMLANRPDLVAQVASGNLGGSYETGLAGPYQTGLAAGYGAQGTYDTIQPLNRSNSFGSAFSPAFNNNF